MKVCVEWIINTVGLHNVQNIEKEWSIYEYEVLDVIGQLVNPRIIFFIIDIYKMNS